MRFSAWQYPSGMITIPFRRRFAGIISVALALTGVVVFGSGLSAGASSAVTTIPVGNAPYAIALNSTGTMAVTVANTDNSVSVIDTATNTVTHTIQLSSNANPLGVTINPTGTEAYVTDCTNYGAGPGAVEVISLTSFTVTGSMTVGQCPRSVAINPNSSSAYGFVPNSNDYTISVFDASTNTVTTSYNALPTGGDSVVINAAGDRMYVSYSGGSIRIWNPITSTALGTISIPNTGVVEGIALNPAGTRLYVSNNTSASAGSIVEIDTATQQIVHTISTPYLNGLAVNHDGSQIYALAYLDSNVLTYSATDQSLLATFNLPAGSGPTAAVMNSAGTLLYVANTSRSTVSVIPASSLSPTPTTLPTTTTTPGLASTGFDPRLLIGSGLLLLAIGVSFVSRRPRRAR